MSRLLGVDLGPGECGLDPGVEQLVGVGQAKGQQRSKAVRPMNTRRLEVVQKAERQVVQLTGVEVDPPGLLGPDVIRLEPGDGLEALSLDVLANVVHAVAVVALVELQIVQRILEVARRRVKALDLNGVFHRLRAGVELGLAHLLDARLAQCRRQAPLNGPADLGARGQACVGHPCDEPLHAATSSAGKNAGVVAIAGRRPARSGDCGNGCACQFFRVARCGLWELRGARQ